MTTLLNKIYLKIVETVSNKAVAIASSQKQAFAYRNLCNQLHAMSDRDLMDIGVSRGDIENIARQSTLNV